MDKEEAVKKLKQYKLVISKYISFERMILFGSYALGNQRDDSDVDVAIVVEEMPEDYFSVRPLLWKIRRDIDDRIEPHPFK